MRASPSKICVSFHPRWGLGDVVCAEPAFDLLKNKYPGCSIYVCADREIHRNNPRVSGHLSEIPRGWEGLHIHFQRWDSFSTEEVAFMEALPTLSATLLFAGGLPYEKVCNQPKLYLSEKEQEWATHVLPSDCRPTIAICCDRIDPRKTWPAKRFEEVARRFAKDGYRVVQLGREGRLGIGIDMVGKTSLRQVIALLSRCDLLLGNNPGPIHFAQSVGVPVVMTSTLSRPSKYLYHPLSIGISADIMCRFCVTDHYNRIGPWYCMRDPIGMCNLLIQSDAVYDAVQSVLGEGPHGTNCLSSEV